MFRSLADQPLPNGRARKARNEPQKAMYGPRRNSIWSASAGDEVFLDQQLDAVGDGLQPAELAADARGTEAVLDAAGDLAFQPDEEHGRARHEADQHRRHDHGGLHRADRRGNESPARFRILRLRAEFPLWPGEATGVTVCREGSNGKDSPSRSNCCLRTLLSSDPRMAISGP